MEATSLVVIDVITIIVAALAAQRVATRPQRPCTSFFKLYLSVDSGWRQLGCLRTFQASEHSCAHIKKPVVARLGSSNVKCLGRVAQNLSLLLTFETLPRGNYRK